MFDLVLYVVAIVAVLAFVGSKPTEIPNLDPHDLLAIATTDIVETIATEIISEIVDNGFDDATSPRVREIISDNLKSSHPDPDPELELETESFLQDGEVLHQPQAHEWSVISEIALADELIQGIEARDFIDECEALHQPQAHPVQLPTDAAAVRALCRLYSVPVSTRGRVNRATRRKLERALAAA